MNDRITFAILCIFFNAYGITCFLQGDTQKGVKRIIFGIISCGVIALINGIKGLILGIEILKMSDEEFNAKKGTFDSGIPA